jgi:hypothetical protein
VTDRSEDFRPLTWRGGRFDEASTEAVGFPLDAVTELARYERLLVQVARGLWKKSNPNRQRAPKRFDEGLRLRLVGVERGCVVPVLQPRHPSEVGTLFKPETWIDMSQEVIAATIAAVVDGSRIPQDFPSHAIPTLVQFGSSLQAGEACIVKSRNQPSVTYTQEARRHLVNLTSRGGIEVEGDLIGRIGALNMNKQTFQFWQLGGPRVEGRLSRLDLLEDIKEAMDRDPVAAFVRLRCQYTTDAQGRLSAIQDVGDVETVVAPDDPLGPKLTQLLGLESGWHDGEGVAPRVEAIEWARDFAAELDDESQELSVFPTLDGGLTLERQIEDRRWSLEIDGEGDVSIAVVVLGQRADIYEPSDISTAAASYRTFVA